MKYLPILIILAFTACKKPDFKPNDSQVPMYDMDSINRKPLTNIHDSGIVYKDSSVFYIAGTCDTSFCQIKFKKATHLQTSDQLQCILTSPHNPKGELYYAIEDVVGGEIIDDPYYAQINTRKTRLTFHGIQQSQISEIYISLSFRMKFASR
jgi:hypothetical protein